jgi:hypothetical protein
MSGVTVTFLPDLPAWKSKEDASLRIRIYGIGATAGIGGGFRPGRASCPARCTTRPVFLGAAGLQRLAKRTDVPAPLVAHATNTFVRGGGGGGPANFF